MADAADFLGRRRISAYIESRHSIAGGNAQALYRVELKNITDTDSGQEIWPRKTVSDGKKWDDVPTGSKVIFDAKLDFDRNNKVQIFNIKNVEVQESENTPWYKFW